MAVAAFVAALEEYRVAQGEQGRHFATREPLDLDAADRRVRQALKQLIREVSADD